MKSHLSCTLIAGCLMWMLLAAPAFATFGQVDQEYHALTFPGAQAGFVSADNRGVAQTFTVGRSGILSAIEVGLIRTEDTESVLIADVRRVVSDVPDFSESGVLATRTLSSSLVPIESYPGIYLSRFTLAIDFNAANLPVVVGDKLAIHLHSNGALERTLTSDPFPWWWIDASGRGGYDAGGVYAPALSTDVVPPLPPGIYPYYGDVHFRTFVRVPEPASMLFILISVAGLFCFKRPQPRRSGSA
jgi:hypothetical protein